MLENYVPFVLFVIVMCGTPGPGNLSMLAIGQATGFRSSLPFLAGTTVGCAALDALVAMGLGRLFWAVPSVAWTMRIAGMAYILYLGVKILRMQITERKVERRFTFLEGLVLHPLSPKSWAMAVAAVSQFMDPAAPLAPQVAVFVLTFSFFQVSFHSLWGVAGASLLRLLRSRTAVAGVSGLAVTLMVSATMYALFV